MKLKICFSLLSLFFVHASFAQAATELLQVGRANAMKGNIYYKKGLIYVKGEDGIFSPTKDAQVTTDPKGKALMNDLRECRKSHAKAALPLGKGESLALYKKATLGTAGTQIAIALVELPVANVPEHDIFNYKPLELRVYDGSKLIAKKEMEEGLYPCALVVDEFSTKGVNQVAFAWVSVGNTHSAGVTMYELK